MTRHNGDPPPPFPPAIASLGLMCAAAWQLRPPVACCKNPARAAAKQMLPTYTTSCNRYLYIDVACSCAKKRHVAPATNHWVRTLPASMHVHVHTPPSASACTRKRMCARACMHTDWPRRSPVTLPRPWHPFLGRPKLPCCLLRVERRTSARSSRWLRVPQPPLQRQSPPAYAPRAPASRTSAALCHYAAFGFLRLTCEYANTPMRARAVPACSSGGGGGSSTQKRVSGSRGVRACLPSAGSCGTHVPAAPINALCTHKAGHRRMHSG